MTDVRIISEPLGGSSLSRLLQKGDAPSHWAARLPASPEDWTASARTRMAAAPWGERLASLAPAFAARGAAAERLARLARDGGVMITTGQQPGLFGGPIYTWSKAMSALALAGEIERRTGIVTVPVFWAATDDADFAEAAETVVARTGGTDVLRASLRPPAGTPMALAPLGDLTDELRRLGEACGSAADPRALEAAVAAYGDPRRTTAEAYVQLLRALLEPLGMPVIDASHEAVREAGAPVIERALRAAAPIEAALARRAAEIRAAGHDPQVEDVAGLSLVFAREGTTKRRLPAAEAATARGGWYTPNVLLRPLVEQEILPTVAYVAGPGELAYFAQVSAVAEPLGVDAPLAVPRWSCTLIEPHVQALLDRFGVSPDDLATPDALEGRVARGEMSGEAERTLAGLRRTIAELPRALAPESGATGLDAAVLGAARALQHRVDRLERRLVAGIKRRETALMRDLATLRAALRPRGGRQERVLNGIPLLARHGLELLPEMAKAAGPHAAALVEPSEAPRSVGATS